MLGVIVNVNAQVPTTLFFMPGVPQSNKINPAIQPKCTYYMGLSGLSPLRLQLTSSSLAYSDVLIQVPGSDSLVLPYHPLADTDAFLEKLKASNFFRAEVGISLISVGVRARKSFFTFDINSRIDAGFSYPKGIFELPANGLPDGITTGFGGFGINSTVFNEVGLGWSREDFFIPNLTIGVRGKALFGLTNISTKSSVLDLTSSVDGWSLNSDMEISASAPPILVDFTDYELDFNDFSPPPLGINNIDLRDPASILNMIFANNFGLAMDLGVNYQPIPQVLLSASMIDIGYINWNNSFTGRYEFDYEFPGLEVNPFGGADSTLLPALIDSLSNGFAFTSGDPYIARLNSKLFIGAAFYPIEKIGFGVLSRTDFLNPQITQQFTGSVNMTTGKFLNLSLSASYMQRKFNNLGAGFSVNLGPFNMYMISDNLVSAALSPVNARSINLWFGANMTFGWKKAKKMKEKARRSPTGSSKKIDMPLIY
jgi:hypothetical protein